MFSMLTFTYYTKHNFQIKLVIKSLKHSVSLIIIIIKLNDNY